MTSRSLCLTVLLAGAALPAAGDPLIDHTPPLGGVIGQPLQLEASIAGTDDAVQLRAEIFDNSSATWRSLEMAASSSGYSVEIPAAMAAGITFHYYISGRTADGVVFAAGSPTEPFGLSLEEAIPVSAAAPPRLLPWLLLVGVLVAVMAQLLRVRARRLRATEAEFWASSLEPLRGLEGIELRAAITRLSRRHLDHPRKGMKKFKPRFLMARLAELEGQRAKSNKPTKVGRVSPRLPKPHPAS